MTPPNPLHHDTHLSPSESAFGQADEVHSSEPSSQSAVSRSKRRLLLEAAERELERVHRRAMASLLRQATAVHIPRSPYYGVLATFPIPPQAVKVWRKRARAALRLAASDEWRPQGIELVSKLLSRPVDGWPPASSIASAARRVEDSEFARISLAYALLCEGEASRSTRIFESLLRQSDVLRHRWRVLEGLALSQQALGLNGDALTSIELAAEDARCGVSALVGGLQLALQANDVKRVRRAAARLDMLADPFAPAFASALGWLRLRRRVLGDPLECASPEVQLLSRELARERRSPAGRVARATL